MKCLVSIFDKTVDRVSIFKFVSFVTLDQVQVCTLSIQKSIKSIGKQNPDPILSILLKWVKSSWQVPFLLFSCDFNSWAKKERTAQQVGSAELRQLSYWVLKNTCFAAFAKEIKSKFRYVFSKFRIPKWRNREDTDQTCIVPMDKKPWYVVRNNIYVLELARTM